MVFDTVTTLYWHPLGAQFFLLTTDRALAAFAKHLKVNQETIDIPSRMDVMLNACVASRYWQKNIFESILSKISVVTAEMM